MTSRVLLCEEGALTAVLADLQPHLRDNAEELLLWAQSQQAQQRIASGLLQHHIPFFFEMNGSQPGSEVLDGEYVHHFDVHGQLVLVERRRASRPPDRWVYVRANEHLTIYQIETFRDKHAIHRVSISGTFAADLGYDMSIDRQKNATAYLWRTTQGLVDTIQVWNMSLPLPDTFTVEYDGHRSPTRLLRGEKAIWKAKQPRKKRRIVSDDIATSAVTSRLVDLVRAKHQARNETVLAYTICAEIGNKEYLPPQIGVVFQQDAEALMASPDKFPDGANSLLDPTLQESYPFPTGTSYPYISVESAQGEDWEWETSTMAKGLSNLVDGMNRLRKPGEPPFVLVDLEDDPARYLDQLDRPDRDTLAQYGLVKIAPIHPERA